MKLKKTRSTKRVKALYDNLMKICEDCSSLFFYKDLTTGMQTNARLFSYNAASADDWAKTDALECRGVMFEIDENQQPVRIMARPMQKFFNLNENQFANKPDWNDVSYYMTKEDGSLISTYFDKGVLGLKSQTTIYSDVAYQAAAWLNNHQELKDELLRISEQGYTVNMEYVGPDNQIVLQYVESSLKILNIRNNITGEYIDVRDIYNNAILRPYITDVFVASDCGDDWVEKVRASEGIEGYIICVGGHDFIKLKTDWYVEKHDYRFTATHNRRLVGHIINKTIDDVRAAVANVPVSMKKIQDFENLYFKLVDSYFTATTFFYHENKHLGRKDYCIAASTKFRGQKYMFDFMMSAFKYQNDSEKMFETFNNYLDRNRTLCYPIEYLNDK